MHSSVALSMATLRLKRPLYLRPTLPIQKNTSQTASMGKRTERALLERRLTTAENIVAAQMQEMELVRQKVYELERNQMQIKARYVLHNPKSILLQVAKTL